MSSESLKSQQIIINIRINQQQIRPYMALAESFPVIMKRMIVILCGKGYIFSKNINNTLQFAVRFRNNIAVSPSELALVVPLESA